MIPEYWSEASRVLSRRDPVMAGLVRQYRDSCLRRRSRPFVTLARSIVAQQISVKAADAVWSRLTAAVGPVTPAALLAAGPAGLAACGLSTRKVEYLLDLAERFERRLIRPARWRRMSDEEVIADLTQIRGIGRWTAEMFLIFNLLRPDVLPVDDIGLQRAVAMHYLGGSPPDRQALLEIGRTWSPWRTVATWYLWRSLDPVTVEY